MTKKHYKAIAEVVKSSVADADGSTAMLKSILVSRLCAVFSADNVKFNSAKFRQACYNQEREDSNEVE